MKAAFVHWDRRIAPVFDVARQILIVEADSGHIVGETQDTLPDTHPVQKVLRLAEHGVGTLVCGAISRQLRDLVSAHGIQVIPFVAGDLTTIVRAWRRGTLRGDAFAMPGCCGHGPRRLRGNRIPEKEDQPMFGKRHGKTEPGGGQGRGGGGRRMGRMGGPEAAGPTGTCFCLQCGHREPHEPGNPCNHKVCPKCGGAMGRE
jgi:predicted Fe-Mo cluster-binding NifX family protein